ncbi:38573_t:CDS:2, partial [Gigaspora margarita]
DLSTQPLSHSESNDSDNSTISSSSNSLNNDPQTHTYWRPSNDLQKLYNKTRSVLPVHMIDENDENPYYNDTIMKYIHRLRIPEFENLTYPQYFEKYSVTPSRPTSHSIVHRDELFNYVVKRKKEIIIRYYQLKIDDGELYFYQQLLLNHPARSEANYKSDPSQTY